jgi:hypothetical protein
MCAKILAGRNHQYLACQQEVRREHRHSSRAAPNELAVKIVHGMYLERLNLSGDVEQYKLISSKYDTDLPQQTLPNLDPNVVFHLIRISSTAPIAWM